MSMWGELHELKTFEIRLPSIVSGARADRLFHELGATLFGDCYAFVTNTVQQWQSDTLLDVDLYMNAAPVDAREDFDRMMLNYLFASRPPSDQLSVLQLVAQIAAKFDGLAFYNDQPFDRDQILAEWGRDNEFLLKEWGEEPGSAELQRMIEENYSGQTE